MKTYKFYVLSRNTYMIVVANCKWDAKHEVMNQYNTTEGDVICVEIFKQSALAV